MLLQTNYIYRFIVEDESGIAVLSQQIVIDTAHFFEYAVGPLSVHYKNNTENLITIAGLLYCTFADAL